MLSWFVANIGTIVVCLIVSAIIALAVFTLARDKKQGKSPCGGSCRACPMGGYCHAARPDTEEKEEGEHS